MRYFPDVAAQRGTPTLLARRIAFAAPAILRRRRAAQKDGVASGYSGSCRRIERRHADRAPDFASRSNGDDFVEIKWVKLDQAIDWSRTGG
jgi:hypothetical protein